MFLLGVLGIGAFFIIIISVLSIFLISTKLIIMEHKVKELERFEKLEGNEPSEIQLMTQAVNKMFDEMAKLQMKQPPGQ